LIENIIETTGMKKQKALFPKESNGNTCQFDALKCKISSFNLHLMKII
jgi:hypothetical protein